MKSSMSFALSFACCAFSLALGTAAPSHAAPAKPLLTFDASHYVARQITVDGKQIAVRAFERIPYVAKPKDPRAQVMNVYVPEAYFHGGSIGPFNARTAPIFFPNEVGGYMPAMPGRLDGRDMPGPGPEGPNTIAVAVSKGYVVASPGARGRTSRDPAGHYVGKAPAAIVDLKAAVRYLRYNDGRMPGDAEKIISNGTSAGGALSALLGASGNSSDYAAELRALGAAPARDDIFAVSAYCPITNLDHADAAYEWQFNGIDAYRKIDIAMLDYKVVRKEVSGTLTREQVRLSNALKSAFPAYVNGLGLRGYGGEALSLDEAGNGSFKDYVKSLLLASAQRALDQGQDLANYDWLRVEAGRVRDLDFDRYLRHLGRMKVTPAFDGIDLGTGENQLFGDKRIDKRHFTDFSVAHDARGAKGVGRADARIVGMMNPMNTLAAPGVQPARYWRIRQGTKDADTSLAVPALLALSLRRQGLPVDFALAWERPHSGDYDLDELFGWMEQVSRTDPATKR